MNAVSQLDVTDSCTFSEDKTQRGYREELEVMLGEEGMLRIPEEIRRMHPDWEAILLYLEISIRPEGNTLSELAYETRCTFKVSFKKYADGGLHAQSPMITYATSNFRSIRQQKIYLSDLAYSGPQALAKSVMMELVRSALKSMKIRLCWNVQSQKVWVECAPPYATKFLSTERTEFKKEMPKRKAKSKKRAKKK